MKRKELILLAIFLLFSIASGLLLYRNFSGTSISFVEPTASTEVIGIRSQADALDAKIKNAIKKLEKGGVIDDLEQNKQFQDLTTAYIKPVLVGKAGRTNPFLSVERPSAEQ